LKTDEIEDVSCVITQEHKKAAKTQCVQVYVISTVLHCSEMPRGKSSYSVEDDEDEGNNIIK